MYWFYNIHMYIMAKTCILWKFLIRNAVLDKVAKFKSGHKFSKKDLLCLKNKVSSEVSCGYGLTDTILNCVQSDRQRVPYARWLTKWVLTVKLFEHKSLNYFLFLISSLVNFRLGKACFPKSFIPLYVPRIKLHLNSCQYPLINYLAPMLDNSFLLQLLQWLEICSKMTQDVKKWQIFLKL